MIVQTNDSFFCDEFYVIFKRTRREDFWEFLKLCNTRNLEAVQPCKTVFFVKKKKHKGT
jgi:hypothetical protein